MTKHVGIKHYLTLLLLPIICIVLSFGYATKYINDEINFVQNEITGLKKTKKIHSIIINLQKLRGISSMHYLTQKYIVEKKQLMYETKIQIEKLKRQINPNNKKYEEDKSIHKFLSYILQLFKEEHNYSKKESFINYTNINKTSFNIQKDIALYSNLKLDSYIKSNILIETIIIQLPQLIEYNGQLRALLTQKSNKVISKNDYIDLHNRIIQINNLTDALSYNMNKIIGHTNNSELKIYFKNTLNSKNQLQDYIFKNYKENRKTESADEIYEFYTKNINFIIDLYHINTKILNQLFKSRINDKISISNYIINIGILSILFILFNFYNYYRKNSDIIETIKESNKKLQEQSISDALTKLYNRRYFDIIFEQRLRQCRREKTSFIFMMCDIDNFKKYNDTYGHSRGDNTLIKVANTLKQTLNRPNDFAFRIGGEEFGILLCDMTMEKAECFAKTIKSNIERLNIEHKTNGAYDFLTISMGISYIHQNITTFNKGQIYNCADQALYKSKEDGRNRITTYTLNTPNILEKTPNNT